MFKPDVYIIIFSIPDIESSTIITCSSVRLKVYHVISFRKHLVNYLSLLCLSLHLQLLIIIVVNTETVSPVVAI